DPGEGAPVELPLPGVGTVEPAEQVEQGRLAGTVGADERGDGVPGDLHVVDVDRVHTAEGPRDVVGHEDGILLRHAGAGRAGGQVDGLLRPDRGGDLVGGHQGPVVVLRGVVCRSWVAAGRAVDGSGAVT